MGTLRKTPGWLRGGSRETAPTHIQARRQAGDQWMHLEGRVALLGGSSRCVGPGGENQLHRWELLGGGTGPYLE